MATMKEYLSEIFDLNALKAIFRNSLTWIETIKAIVLLATNSSIEVTSF